MNKTICFVMGALFGACTGSATTYVLTKRFIEDKAANEIEDYADHRDRREQALKEEISDLKSKLGLINEKDLRPHVSESSDDEDYRINSNEGVKKYHHYDGDQLPEYASKRIFKKPIKEEEMAKKEVKNVSEISESAFLSSDRDKQTIDVLFRYRDNAVDEIWGYQTDNQTTCKARFGKGLIDLIGIDGEDMLDWVEPDEGTAVKYFRNSEMDTDFEIVIHCDHDTYYEIEPEES